MATRELSSSDVAAFEEAAARRPSYDEQALRQAVVRLRARYPFRLRSAERELAWVVKRLNKFGVDATHIALSDILSEGR